jgi:heme/copper-type cytochrome/quinol oxidase subunit 4
MEPWGRRNRDEKKYKSLKVYMRNILKSSLITSVPEITLSKSWTKKIIKITVFIVCLVGFIYQTLDFLWLYLSYPTVVNVLISNPFEIVQPAVTICNRNR